MPKEYKFNNNFDKANPKYPFPETKIPFYSVRPVFSFRFYAKDHSDFSVKSIQHVKEFYLFFERLYDMSQRSWSEIASNPNHYHFHTNTLNAKMSQKSIHSLTL